MFVPKVSIVIPVYNVSKYLRPCLESALAQTLKEIEIICVDDGSTDDSLQILREYEERDSRVVVIHKENGGYGKAVNTGMDAAKGEYFAILESDDVIHANMYETLYRIAKENRIDIIKSDFGRFSIDNGVFNLKTAKIANSESMYGHVIENDPVLALHEGALYTWSGIYRMDFLREHHLRHNETPGASYQDNGFWFLTLSYAERVWFHDEVFYMLRRDNPNSSTQSKAKVYCVRDEYEYIYNFLKQTPETFQKVVGVYWWARFGAYRWSLKRIAAEYKPEFAEHFRDTMLCAVNSGEIDYSLFSWKSWKDLNMILSDPQNFWKDCNDNRSTQKKTMLNRLRWCYEDNGLGYTLKHTISRAATVIKKKRH